MVSNFAWPLERTTAPVGLPLVGFAGSFKLAVKVGSVS
jgi:hypothetical protein